MKLPLSLLFAVIALLAAGNAVAATFIVPTDDELIAKSPAIVIGTVEGSYVQEAHGTIETIYEIRVERAMKGNAPRREELLRIVSLGGMIDDRGVLVPGEAHFEQGQRVLLFLTPDAHGRLRTTDFTLGRFTFRTSTRGERLLVRSMEDVAGWDHAGRPHQEKVRREDGFLRFIEERVHGRKGETDYVVDASAVTFAPDENQSQVTTNAAPFPAATYTDFVNNQPVRWPNMANGVPVYKRSTQNIAGAADGGVSVIQNGLAAWTNECGSVINYSYAGQVATQSQNHDGTNVVEFNDPQERISGSWGGSGTVGICFISFAGQHSFSGQSWLNITDADVVFQNGYTASNASFGTAMTHELGHGLGWRHSNQNHATGGACNPAVEECTSAAIMNSTVNSSYGFTLQPWDVNAAQSVYPGGVCGGPACIPPVITSQPQSMNVTFGTTRPISVSATGTNLRYQWYFGRAGDTSSPIAGGTAAAISASGLYTRLYWVRVYNECGSADSATAVVSVLGSAAAGSNAVRLRPVAAGWRMVGAADFTGDSNEDILLQSSSGQLVVWNTIRGGVIFTDNFVSPRPVSSSWRAILVADFNADTRPDILLQNQVSNDIYVWTMNGLSATNTEHYIGRTAPGWRVVAGGDLNRDGSVDLIVSNAASRQNAVWRLSGLGVVSTEIFLPGTAPGWEIQAVGDLSGDGWRDIVVRNTSTGDNAVWVMNGYTVVSDSTYLPRVANTAWRIVSSSDFNGDGRVDLLWQSGNTDEAAIWIMNGFNVVTP